MKHSKSLIRFFGLLIVLLLLASPYGLNPVFAETVTVSGKIEKITSLGSGRFELSVQTDEGVSTFVVDQSTVVQAEVSAAKLKKGQKIVVSGGPKKALGGMSAKTKKMLGLPDIPEVPQLPDIPQVPKVPEVPKNPLKKSSSKKEAPSTEEAPQNLDAMIPQGGPAGQQGEASEKKPEAEFPELEDPGYGQLNPGALSTATSQPVEQTAKKVLELKTSKEGIALKLEGETGEKEEVVLAPGQKVLQVLNIQDLQKSMNVQLEVSKDAGENLVERILIS